MKGFFRIRILERYQNHHAAHLMRTKFCICASTTKNANSKAWGEFVDWFFIRFITSMRIVNMKVSFHTGVDLCITMLIANEYFTSINWESVEIDQKP